MSSIVVRLEDNTYYPGSVIRGEAVCHFRSSKQFRDIRLRLNGNESTYWTKYERYYDHRAKKSRSRSVSYTGSHDFISLENIVYGEGELPSGDHVFPINFTLPYDLPSSYSCSRGRIAYSVKLTVNRQYKFDLQDVKEFTVVSPIRLQNVNPLMLERADLSDEKTVCCWCCDSGNIEMQVHLETRGFLIGEKANIKVYCLNMSNVSIERLIVELRQTLRYKTTHPFTDYKFDQELVARSAYSGVGAHGEKSYNLFIEVPPTTQAPNFSGADLFLCDYILKISAIVSGCHTNLNVSTSVVLGHIPRSEPTLMSYAETQQQPSDSSENIMKYTDGAHANGQSSEVTMPMPMPPDGYGLNVTPYSSPAPPTAPRGIHPSAPLINDLDQNSLSAGNVSTDEAPPPSYEVAIKDLTPLK